jgi:hypothetical protein
MNEVINGGTADVHPNMLRINGFEGGFSSTSAVSEE